MDLPQKTSEKLKNYRGTMLNIKELEVLRHAIDNVDSIHFGSDDYELLQKTRSKISDMILVQIAWNNGKRIIMESNIM